MKQIKETEKLTTIIVEDGDVLEIMSLKKSTEKVVIKCLNSVLHIDEILIEDIKKMQMEKEEMKKMDEHLKEHEND